jgi:hypothetical protein
MRATGCGLIFSSSVVCPLSSVICRRVRTLSFPARAAIALALSTAVLLGGCATSQIEADQDRTSSIIVGGLPKWAGGEPANVPPRSATQPAYPAINAPVAPRESQALTTDEQNKAIADLVAARTRTLAQAKAAHQDEDIASDEGLALARGKYAGDAPPER